jgi:hypothetical protein
MTGWQITAKTIYCDAVDDEVTVIVSQNGSTRCTGCNKYNRPNSLTRDVIREKSRYSKRPIQCEGEPCPRMTQYKEQILAEETQ